DLTDSNFLGALCYVSCGFAQGTLTRNSFSAVLCGENSFFFWLPFSCDTPLTAVCVISLQTRMQVLNPSSGGLYTGLTNAFSTIYRIEGWRTLWKGVSSVIVGAGMSRTKVWEGIILGQNGR